MTEKPELDIVKRLRGVYLSPRWDEQGNIVGWDERYRPYIRDKLFLDAADEIVRLRQIIANTRKDETDD